ncbi:MAG: hypothetical protein IKW58_00925 [Alphaproteobacteria bacterium]|nr:hypothetical protein [Alphaproteobacteria bacterium]
MEKIVSILKGPFVDFLSGPYVPLVLIIIVILTFGVIYYKDNKALEERQKQCLNDAKKK